MASDRTVDVPGERDVLLTGMGFCLPGLDRPCFTADDVWAVASKGASCLTRGDIYYGSVALTAEMFDERLPDIPGLYRRQLTRTHRLGLISFAEACADGGLDYHAGDLAEAAILTGRGSVDDNVRVYRDLIDARPEELGPDVAVGMYIPTQLGATPYNVALLQASVAGTREPRFSVTCGCSSSTIQLGNALRMIQAGEVAVAVVTGVDSGDADLARQAQGIFLAAERGGPAGAPGLVQDQLSSTDHLMHPYDERAGSVGFGEGSGRWCWKAGPMPSAAVPAPMGGCSRRPRPATACSARWRWTSPELPWWPVSAAAWASGGASMRSPTSTGVATAIPT